MPEEFTESFMEVILLDKIGRFGNLGDKVKVRNGFARNYLLPKKKAVLATKENLEKFEKEKAQLEAKIAAELKAAQERAEKLAAIGKFTITAMAGDEGKLFGSVGTRDIADIVTAAGVEIKKSEVRLPEGVLRTIGEHLITVQLHPDIKTEITVNIVREGSAGDTAEEGAAQAAEGADAADAADAANTPAAAETKEAAAATENA